jgi:hypothetical protein
MVVLWIFLGWLACVSTAVVLGLLLFRLLRVSLQRLESLCLGFVAGSAVLSCLVFAIAALGIARKGVFLTLAVVTVAGAICFRRWLLPPAAPPASRIPIEWKILLAAVMVIYGILYFRQAASPEMSPDGMMYHLGLVNLFNHAHGFVRYVDMYACLPQGIEMLFLYAFSIGKHSAASLVHFSFLLDLVFLMVLYGRRFGFASAGVAGALVVFASPLVGADGTCAYNDVALAAVTFAAVYLLALWRSEKSTGEKSTGMLAACCIVTGFTMAIKYTAIFFALFVLAAILIGVRDRPWRRRVQTVATAGLIMSLCVAPYLVRNALWFHNPIAFFGNSIFPNPYFHVAFEQYYKLNLAHLGGLEWWDMPLELTLGGPHVEGFLGPGFLLAPLALVSLCWPQGRLLVLAAMSTMISFPNARSPRYLIPALPMLAMAMMFVLSRIRWPQSSFVRQRIFSSMVLGAVVIADLAICWPPTLDRRFRNPGWHVERIPWAVVFRKVPEYAWLSTHSEEYVITRKIDAAVPKGQSVFSLGSPGAPAYGERRIVNVFQSAPGETLGDALYSTWNSATAGWRRRTYHFPEVNAAELRFVQRGRSREGQWSISEVHLRCHDKEVLLGKTAHPYAWPNPWDAGLAFDGSEVTRWRTWEPMKPGMRLGVRFNAPVRLDELAVNDFPDEWDSRATLRVLNERGQWIEEPPPVWEILAPVDRRKEATQFLVRAGFHYILLSRRAWNSAAFIDRAAGWGLVPVASTANLELFRIQ